MAFARLQGNTIRVFQSRRYGKNVRQEQLYCFPTLDDAWTVVHSQVRWKSTAMAMLLANGKDGSCLAEMDKVREQIRGLLKESEWYEQREQRLPAAARQLNEILREIDPSLTEPSAEALRAAKDELTSTRYLINSCLARLENYEKGDETLVDEITLAADKLLDFGMEYYWVGDWRKAQEHYLAGLELAPEHVDLNVHSGLCCLLADQPKEALAFFDKAVTTGMPMLLGAIQDEPDRFMFRRDFERKWAGVTIPEESAPDIELDEDGFDKHGNLRVEHRKDEMKIPQWANVEFRPLFRAAGNKIQVLQLLGRHEEAIQFALQIREIWSCKVDSQIGYSFMCMGDYEQADRWSEHSAPLQKAFIKLMLNDRPGFLEWALHFVCDRPLLAAMLTGYMTPLPERGYGDCARRAPYIDASNSFLDEPIYAGNSQFRNALRFVVKFDGVKPVFDQFVEELKHRDDDSVQNRNSRKGMLPESVRPELIDRMIVTWEDVDCEYWLPAVGEILRVNILERKQTHWLVQLSGADRQFHYRISGDDWKQSAGSGVVRISKAWHHRKRLYVMGEFQPSGV